MFSLRKPEQEDPILLDRAIGKLLTELNNHDGESEEALAISKVVKTLYEAKATIPEPDVVSANTMATIAANLLGIVLVIGYERTHVITSKALGFVLKTKT